MDKQRAGEKTTKERIRRLKTIMEGDPASVAFFPLSKVLYSAGNVDDAIQTLEKGLSYHPEFMTARMDLARIYREVGHDDNAINQLERLVSLDYYNIDALKTLATILLEQGYNKEALRHLKRLQELDPENDVVQQMIDQALLAIEQAEVSEPAPTITVPERHKPPTTSSEFNTLTMVDIYIKQGLWKKAAEVCKNIIAHDPSNQDALEKLSEIEAELSKIQRGESLISEEPELVKTSWQSSETVPLAPAGSGEKDTADLLLDKWEEFRDLIATSGTQPEKRETDTTVTKPLITDEELERFAASISNLTTEAEVQPTPHEEEIAWEAIVKAEEVPPEVSQAAETELIEEFVAFSFPSTQEELPEQLVEEITSAEFIPTPELAGLEESDIVPVFEDEQPYLEEIKAPLTFTMPELMELDEPTVAQTVGEAQNQLEEISIPEFAIIPELEEIEEPVVTTLTDETLSGIEEITAPPSFINPELGDLEEPTIVSVVEEKPYRLEEITAPQTILVPDLEELEEPAFTPIAEEIPPRLEEITAPQFVITPKLEDMEQPEVIPDLEEELRTSQPRPLEDVVPPEEALTLEGPASLDEFIRSPEPPITEELGSIDDLLGEQPAQAAPPQPVVKEAPLPEDNVQPSGDFPEFKDWLDRLNDQNT